MLSHGSHGTSWPGKSLTLQDFVAATAKLARQDHLSLQGMCSGQNVVGALLDLMMYEDGGLTAAALDLLVLHFNSFATLSRALHSVQLLVSSAAISTYRHVVRILPKFSVLSETSEVWMGAETPEDLRTARHAVHLVHVLTDAMWVTEEEALAGRLGAVDAGSARLSESHMNMLNNSGRTALPSVLPSHTKCVACLRIRWRAWGSQWRVCASRFIGIDAERQHLLHNMGVPKQVMTLLHNGYSMLVNRKNAGRAKLSFVKGLFHLFSHAYR